MAKPSKTSNEKAPAQVVEKVAAASDAVNFTEAQLQQAQAQAVQRAQAEHAVLKMRFADVSVALAIAEQERGQLLQRLQAAQQVIQKLTTELAEVKQESEQGTPTEPDPTAKPEAE